MEEYVRLTHGPVSATVILKEIAPKGKGYIVMRGGAQPASRADFTRTIDDATDFLLSNGAREVLMTPGFPLPAAVLQTEKYVFVFEHEIRSMEADLTAAAREEESGGLRFAPLTAGRAEEYRRLYNDCFRDVPNSATYNAADVGKLLEGGQLRAFFIESEGETAGIAEISLRDDTPEINAFGLKEELRGRGFGRASMRKLLRDFAAAGFPKVTLKVSTINKKAYRLYLSEGFVKTGAVSSWFRLT